MEILKIECITQIKGDRMKPYKSMTVTVYITFQ